jgi:hypothetical protein
LPSLADLRGDATQSSQTPAGALGAIRERRIEKVVDLGTVQYPNMTQVIEASLPAANDDISASRKFLIVHMHSSLSVLRKQQ